MKKNLAYHLYKLNNKKISKLEAIELKSERADIQNIFENNLNDFFPKLEFLKSEHSFAVSQNRVDSIAYHARENTFLIIEYKTLKGARGGKVKNQALNYLNDLKNDLTEQFDLVNFWNKEKNKQSKWLNYRDIKWEKAKVICISPFFHPHESSDKETILITIEKYENDVLYLEGRAEQLELLGIKKNIKKSGEEAKENKRKSQEPATFSPTETVDKQTINLEKFFLERGIKAPQIKEWVDQIDSFLRNKYFLDVKLLTKSQSKSSWVIKYSSGQNTVLSLVPQQRHINVYLNKLTEDDDLSTKLIEKHSLKDYRNIGHSGDLGNDWQYLITDDNSFQPIFALLTSYLKK